MRPCWAWTPTASPPSAAPCASPPVPPAQPLYADIAEALVARIPGADHERLDGLDHMAPVLRPDAIAAAVEDFLDR